MTGDQHTLFVHQDRVGPPPFQDGGGDPLDVGRAVKPRIVRIGDQPFDRPQLDPFGWPWPCRARHRRNARPRCSRRYGMYFLILGDVIRRSPDSRGC